MIMQRGARAAKTRDRHFRLAHDPSIAHGAVFELAMSDDRAALAWAEAQVAVARDDPGARLALLDRTCRRADRPCAPACAVPAGSPLVHALADPARSARSSRCHAGRQHLVAVVNAQLLCDGCEALALVGGRSGDPSSQAVRLWLDFIASPTPHCWYRAHNASIVTGYLKHEGLASNENAPERFFMNIALVRVLYAHALVGAPRLALGRLAPIAASSEIRARGGRRIPLASPRHPERLPAHARR